jgi:hypothetical protein
MSEESYETGPEETEGEGASERDPLVEAQEGKGYGADEGEREDAATSE